jgi:hypothetical protein
MRELEAASREHHFFVVSFHFLPVPYLHLVLNEVMMHPCHTSIRAL